MQPQVVLITHPEEGAGEFARRLVEHRLAACCNLVDVTSVYRWEGAVEEGREVLLVVKTTAERLGELERFLETDHPYDVPELVALPAGHVAAPYLAWIGASVAAVEE